MGTNEPQIKKTKRKKALLEDYDFDDVFQHNFPQFRKLKWYQYFCDRTEKKCCLKTPKEWFHLLIFYFIFLMCLLAMYLICFQFLFLNILPWEVSVKKPSPGISFEPSLEESQNIFINFKRNDTEKLGEIVKKISNLIEEYKEKSSHISTKKIDTKSMFGECNKDNYFGYKAGKPCILVKINQIDGFIPEPYDDDSFPNDMPNGLKDHIRALPRNNTKCAWLSCRGLTTSDVKSLGNVVYYPPSRGIQINLFPSNTHPIAVQFPNIKLQEKVSVECRFWAENIIYKKVNVRNDLFGSVTFDIRIE